MLPPAEKSPILLVKWSEKARKDERIIPLVKKELQHGNILVVPNPSNQFLLLTATQRSLEEQAQRQRLIKLRIFSKEQSFMDHFTIDHRLQFCSNHDAGAFNITRDTDGLFTVHERAHLVLGILERIQIQNQELMELLKDEKHRAETSSLRYALQSHEWIDVLAPLHVDDQKAGIQTSVMWPLWQVMPPIDQIQAYYGPHIAYYFAFLGFLGRWLVSLGLLGLSSFLFRLYRNDSIDEDEYTPVYGLICFLWAILMFRFWERKENELAYRWGTMELSNAVDGFETETTSGYGHRRPEFSGIMRPSPVTGLPELYYPGYRRKIQYLLSAIVTVLMLSFAFFAMILSLNLQGYIRPRERFQPFYYPRLAALAEEGAVFDAKSSWRCFIPVIIHALCILTLNTLYRSVAKKLTDWENHETKRAYDNSLILKRFLFEAFDCYIVLFYLAFFERDVNRLRTELIAVFNIDSFRRLLMEVIIPMVLHYQDPKDNEHPHDLHLDEYEGMCFRICDVSGFMC